MVVGVVAIAVMLPFAYNQEAPASTAAPIPTRTADAEPARVLVVGDSYTAGSGEGGVGDASWAALADVDLAQATLDVSAVGGSGYVQPGQSGETFTDLARAADGAPYDLIVFFGSRNDDQGGVQPAALEAFEVARAESPDAPLLVIGPPWVDASPPAFVQQSSQEVEDAAAEVQATFVDPLDEGWFTGAAQRFIGSDGVHPTDEGHAYMAEKIAPLIAAALG